jgi:lantibiotic modifying enzyme
MKRQVVTRRELIGMGLGAAAGMIVLPRLLSARGLSAPPVAPVDNLDLALKAARWIRRSRIETANGATWPIDPTKPAVTGSDLFSGMPGVIIFNLELFYATGDKSWLDDARLGANELTSQLPALQAAQRAGLYDGLAGALFVLEETHKATGEGRYRDASSQALDMIHGLAQRTSIGAQWTGPSGTNDVISGTAGIGLTLAWAAEALDAPPSRALALLAGKHLIDSGVPAKGGAKWPVTGGDSTFYPNFAHGTSGVGFFLAKLFASEFDRQMYGGALQATRYLDAVASTADGHYKLFQHEPGGENVYYMGWADGIAGTARLFTQLGEMARTEHWNGMAEQCAQTILAAGVPEKQAPGDWNTVDQCNGTAGIGEFFIKIQRITPKPAYADMVQRIAGSIASRATADGDGLKWLLALDRDRPETLVAQTGFMHGAAGIGSFFLHADDLTKGRVSPIKWPDAPTTGPCEVPAGGKKARDMSDIAGGPTPRC